MTNHKSLVLAVFIVLISMAAVAADFGAHIGYYDNDVKKAYIGVDLGLPIGPIAIMPNIDYWRANGYGYWLGGADVDLKWAQSGGPSFWVGAGPTYGYVSGTGGSSGGYALHARPFDYNPGTPGSPSNPSGPTTGAVSTGGAFGNGKDNAWGWDVNGGVSFGAIGGNFRPYITGRYNKVKDLKAGGIAIGLRFGH